MFASFFSAAMFGVNAAGRMRKGEGALPRETFGPGEYALRSAVRSLPVSLCTPAARAGNAEIFVWTLVRICHSRLPLTFAHARLHLSLACRKSAFAFLAVSRAVRLRRLLHGFARVLIFSDNRVPEILLQKRSASRNIRSHLRARVSCGAPPPHEARSAR